MVKISQKKTAQRKQQQQQQQQQQQHQQQQLTQTLLSQIIEKERPRPACCALNSAPTNAKQIDVRQPIIVQRSRDVHDDWTPLDLLCLLNRGIFFYYYFLSLYFPEKLANCFYFWS
ncbi:hypothetical protein T4D_15305 [Trichinella pseudospiralis]|uniref:Uncharacterized protein n=1 Tax=Trichinella pseudospiralis TaxID=6337 RepID=A0A0V1FIT1_TRIPS|nr:hypothetical protein T4D_15305 [Trichinella pseudospiralis]